MKRNITTMKQDGFTLIETIMAMAIFTIGILGLFGMQTAAIKKNLAGNNITTGATLASARVEELIALNYEHPDISDEAEYQDCSFFSDPDAPDWWNNVPECDKFGGETANQADYFVCWAVSRNCTMVKEGDKGLEEDSPYRPKHLYIAVTRDNGSGDKKLTAQFSYIKQNPNY